MNKWAQVRATFLAITLALLSSDFACAAAPHIPSVGYIDSIQGARGKTPPVMVTRDGSTINVNQPGFALLSGDLIELKDLNATVTIRLDSGKQILLYKGSHKGNRLILVNQSALPVSDRLFAWFGRILPKHEEDSAITASRGLSVSQADKCANYSTDNPVEFSLSALTAPVSKLAAGTRDLFIPWKGGLPPFLVTLANTSTGQIEAQKTVTDACEVLFPGLTLHPGRHVLSLRDANDVTLSEDHLDVVEAVLVPPIPDELKQEPLPEELRTQYYVVWLANLDDGQWTLESIQRARPCAKSSSRLSQWIGRWGGGQYNIGHTSTH